MSELDTKSLIKKFHKFFDEYKKKEIRKLINEGQTYFPVCFFEISEYDFELGEQILSNPIEIISIMEQTLKQFFEEENDINKTIKIRFTSIPTTEQLLIRDIRSSHLGKLVMLEGLVRRKTDVRPRLLYLEYLCTNPSCNYSQDKLKVPQLEDKAKQLKACPKCKSGIELVNKILIDSQNLVLEEIPEHLENSGDQPKRINVLLQGDLTSPFKDSKTNPGAWVYVIGIVKEIPLTTKTGAESINYEIIIDGNYIALNEDDYSEIIISKEEEETIKELAAKDDVVEILVKNTAPSIYGYNRVKEAILLQLFGGNGGTKGDGVKTRGNIHILLLGDPGAAKSQLLKSASKIAPKSIFVSGKSATGVGLTASVIKDEITKGWALEAGAIVLASGGVCCTTHESKFITQDYKQISFGELFKNIEGEGELYPKFKVLALNEKTSRIEPFAIKRAFKIKNKEKIYQITTRTGRKLNLTQDNEVLTIENSNEKWILTKELTTNDYIAVPKVYSIEKKDDYGEDFAYLAGLVASDGHIQIDNRHAKVSIYNTDENLIEFAKKSFENLGLSYSICEDSRINKGGIIGGRVINGNKKLFNLYHCKKDFANKLIKFGVPSGNKSSVAILSDEILSYSSKTIALFLKGVFDGDGSIRKNPYEITIVCGIYQNCVLFKQLFLRLGIISSVKKSTRSWHCSIRGRENCQKFYDIVSTNHPQKKERLSTLLTKEVKDRIDILPNSQELFKQIRKDNSWSLGKDYFKYFWNYSRAGVTPSISKLKILNAKVKNEVLEKKLNSDILWDKVVSINEIKADYVYDFTMNGTNNFVANDIIMHNCIDEMDKMSDEDTSAMHEALEQQTISIAKANIRATLKCETTVLGAANPKFGRFDPYGDISKQVNFPPALISRFDLIFIVRDIPDKKRDDMIANHILQTHRDITKSIAEITPQFLKKYIAYTKTLKPVLTQAAIEKIKDFYVSIRNASAADENGVKAIPVTARQLEAIVRLAESYAKIKLDTKVREEHAIKAIDMLMYCLEKIGIDPKTGQLDIDKITSGITASTRNQYKLIQQIIERLETQKPEVSYEDICEEAEKQGIKRTEVQKLLDKLKNEGVIFEPRKNVFKKLP